MIHLSTPLLIPANVDQRAADALRKAEATLGSVAREMMMLRIVIFGTRVMRFESERDEDVRVFDWLRGRDAATRSLGSWVCRRVMSENGACYEPEKRASAHAVITTTDESQTQALKLLDDLGQIAGELRECRGLSHIRAFGPHQGNEPVEWWTVLLDIGCPFASRMRDRTDSVGRYPSIGAEYAWDDVSVPWDGDSVCMVCFPSLVRCSVTALRVLAEEAAATCK